MGVAEGVTKGLAEIFAVLTCVCVRGGRSRSAVFDPRRFDAAAGARRMLSIALEPVGTGKPAGARGAPTPDLGFRHSQSPPVGEREHALVSHRAMYLRVP